MWETRLPMCRSQPWLIRASERLCSIIFSWFVVILIPILSIAFLFFIRICHLTAKYTNNVEDNKQRQDWTLFPLLLVPLLLLDCNQKISFGFKEKIKTMAYIQSRDLFYFADQGLVFWRFIFLHILCIQVVQH
jgi:hypothetical protein